MTISKPMAAKDSCRCSAKRTLLRKKSEKWLRKPFLPLGSRVGCPKTLLVKGAVKSNCDFSTGLSQTHLSCLKYTNPSNMNSGGPHEKRFQLFHACLPPTPMISDQKPWRFLLSSRLLSSPIGRWLLALAGLC